MVNFDKLLAECLAMWPETFDISDGHFIAFSPARSGERQGFRSQHLIHAWEKAEFEAKHKGEWQELMTWIIYKSLHQMAAASFLNQVYSFDRELVRQDVFQLKQDLAENLRHADYRQMLQEYVESNR